MGGELSPVYDLPKDPWVLLGGFLKKMIYAHLALTHTEITKRQREITLIDAGCGCGEEYPLLKRARKFRGSRLNYIGIDFDLSKEKFARKYNPEIDFRCMDIHDIENLPEVPVDCIMCGIVENFPKTEGPNILRILSNSLKRGGILICNYTCPLDLQYRYAFRHETTWGRSEINEIISGLGMEILDSFLNSVPQNYWNIKDKRLHRIPYDISRPAMSLLSDGPGMEGFTIARKL